MGDTKKRADDRKTAADQAPTTAGRPMPTRKGVAAKDPAAVAAILRGSMRTKGVVTIPQDIRRQVDLNEGDEVIFTVEDGKVVITPAAVIPRDQAWFWTPEWQAKEAEAEADLAAGRFDRYGSDEDFLASLDNA